VGKRQELKNYQPRYKLHKRKRKKTGHIRDTIVLGVQVHRMKRTKKKRKKQ